jgi:tetratricopeptide (TPR) repeat protein
MLVRAAPSERGLLSIAAAGRVSRESMPTPSDAKFQEGLDHFRNANYMAAIDLWQELREGGFAHPSLLELLRSARLERSKALQHAEALNAALDRLAEGAGSSASQRAAAARAREALRARRQDEAGEALAEALADSPGDATLTLALARVRCMQGRAREAHELAEVARGLAPRDVEPLAVLGQALLDLDRGSEAERAFLGAIDIEGAHHRAWCGLASVYYGQQRLTLAVECLRKALASRPADLAALSFLDEVRTEIETARSAIDEARRMVSEHPEFADWHFRLGKLLALAAAGDEALRCYGRALEANPRYARCWHERAGLHLREGRVHEALADLKKGLELVGLHDDESLARARAREAAGDLAEAAIEYWHALRAEPDIASRHIELGKLFHREGLLDQATRELSLGVSIKPQYADGHHVLGLVALAQGRPDRAQACFEAALAVNPHYGRAAVALVEAHLEAGRRDEARAAVDRARELARGEHELRRLGELVARLEGR